MARKKAHEKTPGHVAKIRDDAAPRQPAVHVRPGVKDAGAGAKPGTPVTRRRAFTTQQYVEGVLAADRTVLARAITLVESNAPAHFEQAQQLVQALLPHRGRATRVGVTGIPGAGKSTFIETLGGQLTAQGRRVAVTAVDPSSTVTGGSVLGDKTRMQTLGTDPLAFVRPSPSGGTLGGVTRKTRETIVLFEAAGYDVVLVETMGVGQSETVVRSLVDFFLLLLAPSGGDELQGIKKGVVELADAIVINKADGPREDEARLAQAEYEHALHYLRPASEGWRTRALVCSALTGAGVAEIWQLIEHFIDQADRSGALLRRRRDQERQWLHALVREQLLDLFHAHDAVKALLPDLERRVVQGDLSAVTAARQLLAAFLGEGAGNPG